ncbi:MAG TPA: MerR family transcriptional regulator [Geminicoccaceae bacterium]|nr:MerR family transcriptional regulator [Geminicoccaceae bacterium]
MTRTLVQVVGEVGRLQVSELEAWVRAEWVRPERGGGEPRFTEVDVARVRLICELREDLGVEEETLPLVLSLVDQLYRTRRRLRELTEALTAEPPEVQRRVLERYCRALAGPAAGEAPERPERG